jgi:hypothetical protein
MYSKGVLRKEISGIQFDNVGHVAFIINVNNKELGCVGLCTA